MIWFIFAATLLVDFAPVHCSLISVPLSAVTPHVDWLQERLLAVPCPSALASDLTVAPVALAAVARTVDNLIMGNPNKGGGKHQGKGDKNKDKYKIATDLVRKDTNHSL